MKKRIGETISYTFFRAKKEAIKRKRRKRILQFLRMDT